jgi:Protein of unknown function (DUF3298)/Mannan-binding protein
MALSKFLGAALAVTALAVAPPASASAPAFCGEIGGNWDGVYCRATVDTERRATRDIKLALPDGLVDSPVIADYLRTLMDNWRNAAVNMAADSFAEETFETFNHGGATTVVFHEVYSATWGTDAGSHPNAPVLNNGYRTFTFAGGRQLQLADVLKPGTPLAAIPPLAHPYVVQALDRARPAHQPGTYPFYPERWTPDKVYSGGYKAWALTPNELILYMPDYPVAYDLPIDFTIGKLKWWMDGGAVQVHIPLAALSPIMRPEYGGT